MGDFLTFGMIAPSEPVDWQTLGAILVGFFSLAGAVFAALRTSKSAREANAITFSRDLMARVESLEDDVKELREEQKQTMNLLSVSLSYIERLIYWGRTGGRDPEPEIPSKLRDRLDHLINHRREA